METKLYEVRNETMDFPLDDSAIFMQAVSGSLIYQIGKVFAGSLESQLIGLF